MRPVEGGISIAVSNEGDGIEEAEIAGLFRRFHRTAQTRQGSVPGIGLGLYIARGLVEAHGGRLWVESTPGEKTTFFIFLPAR